MTHLHLAFELTVLFTIGSLFIVFCLWCAVSLWRDFRNSGTRITNEELNRERTTILIPLSLKDLK